MVTMHPFMNSKETLLCRKAQMKINNKQTAPSADPDIDDINHRIISRHSLLTISYWKPQLIHFPQLFLCHRELIKSLSLSPIFSLSLLHQHLSPSSLSVFSFLSTSPSPSSLRGVLAVLPLFSLLSGVCWQSVWNIYFCLWLHSGSSSCSPLILKDLVSCFPSVSLFVFLDSMW